MELDGGEPIVATDIHRFWQSGKGWKMARELKPGDRLRVVGGTARVIAIVREPRQLVYNLEVAGPGDFFVGQAGVLVHDATLVPPVDEGVRSESRGRRLSSSQVTADLSIQFVDMFPAVGGIADQRSAAEVHHEIEMFQRQLADQDGHIIRDFHHIHRAASPPDGQPDGLVKGGLGDANAAADLLG